MEMKKSGRPAITAPAVYKPASLAVKQPATAQPKAGNNGLTSRPAVAYPPPAAQAKGLVQPLRPPVALPPGMNMHSNSAVGGPEVAQLKGFAAQIIQCNCGACGSASHSQKKCKASQDEKNAYRLQRMQGKHGGGAAHGRRRNIPAARAERQAERARAEVAARAEGK